MKELLPNSELHYLKNTLTWGNIPLSKASGQLQTPFYLYNEQILLDNFKRFQASALKNNIPKPLVCYALKANANPRLVSLLAKAGAGADIVSGGEFKRAISSRVPAHHIVFSGVGKTQAEIDTALTTDDGILAFNVESISELELIAQRAKHFGKKAKVALRYNPEVHAMTHKHISTGHRTHKFGLIKKDIMTLMKKKALWKNVQFQGLSVHIGSQLLDFQATGKAVERACKLLRELDHPFHFLDVGGGLGVDYSPTERAPKGVDRLDDYMNIVSENIHRHLIKPKVVEEDFRVLFEPGRSIVARAGLFITKVLRTKDSGANHFVIVDGGMNDFGRTSLYGAYHEILPFKKTTRPVRKTTVVGPICETADCFASGRKLLPMKENEFLAVADTGAYGFSMSSHYNLRNLPKEYLLTPSGDIQDISHFS